MKCMKKGFYEMCGFFFKSNEVFRLSLYKEILILGSPYKPTGYVHFIEMNQVIIVLAVYQVTMNQIIVLAVSLGHNEPSNNCSCWRKCWLPAFSPFPTMFSKGFLYTVIKSLNCVVKS